MAFTSINRQFTLDTFAAWLASLPRQSWPRGSTYHNTYIPTEAQWQGKATMDGMQASYVAKGWTTGPHIFLALHSPNPAHNGIWVMTPPLYPGTHAGVCNADHFGIEVVGDFHMAPPSAAQQQLLIDVLTVLHRWAKLGPALDAHRDCMPGRTCPGDAFYALKGTLQQRLAAALVPDWPALWGSVATPDQTSWAWDIPQTWKVHYQRLGKCIGSALYDNQFGIVVQPFEGGDVRQRTGRPTEVCFK